MSKVKIQGNASGTGVFTIEAPGTNDPRTLTLPDATGTLLNSDGDGSNLTGLTTTGSWTPEFRGNGVALTATYSSNTIGTYIKIGDIYFCFGYIGTESKSGGAGGISIGGLPATVGNVFNPGGGSLGSRVNWTNRPDSIHPTKNTDQAQLFYGLGSVPSQYGDLLTGTGKNQMDFLIIYKV